MPTEVLENVLSDFERSLLVQHEQAIEKAFLSQGESLKVILEEKLWRADYDSFDHYCVTRWKIKSKYAYRLIRAYEIYMSTNCRLERESHYQSLDKASPLGVEITAKLINTLEGHKITANDVKSLVMLVEAAVITGAVEIDEGKQVNLSQLAALEASALTELIERKKRQLQHIADSRKPIAQFGKGIALEYVPAQIRGVLKIDDDAIVDSLDVFRTASGFTVRGVLK